MADNNFEKSRFTFDRVVWFGSMVALFFIQQHRLENSIREVIADMITKQEVTETKLSALTMLVNDMDDEQEDMKSQLSIFSAYVPDRPAFKSYKKHRR